MALSAAGLSAVIKTQLLSANGGSAADNDQLQAFCDALAAAIVSYITSNAQVVGTATVAGGSSAGAHPVTGTVT